MSRTSRKIGEILVQRGFIDGGQLTSALDRQQRGERNLLGLVLVQMGFTGPEEVAQSLAEQFGWPYLDLGRVNIEQALVWRVPREMAEANLLVPIDKLPSGLIRVAVANPRNLNAIRDVEFLLRSTVSPVVASSLKIQQAIQRHYSMEAMAQQVIANVGAAEGPGLLAHAVIKDGVELDSAKVAAQLRTTDSKPYVDLLNLLLSNAVERRASDIHFEPQQDDMRIRYRIDGMLREVLVLPTFAIKPLTSRIKVVGKLDLSAINRPQDGKIGAMLAGRKLDLRISVIPTAYGDKVVIRLLDSAMLQTDLGELGWQPKLLSAYYRMVSQPQGMVLSVGPTGSGKSTTLYATIQRLKSETTAIITVEDPIEYTLPGITQVQVNEKTGMSFGNIVRSLLRQDPNVIVIGEIRDAETADAALEAANTGHLVLSTLHTNHSINTITRLLDLKVPPYLLGSTLHGIVAQRLVRRVCPVCSVVGEPEREDWLRLGIDAQFSGQIRRAGPGCAQCRFIGYSGRVGVFEVLTVSDAIRELILQGATEYEIWKKAREEGLVTLFEDAMYKVKQGMTTLEEITRVVPLDAWRDERSAEPARVEAARRQAALLQSSAEQSLSSGQELVLLGAEGHDAPLLDMDMEALEPLDEAAPDEVVSVRRQKILIADDADEILNLVAITLEDDFDIEVAHDGQEALEKVPSARPDLMILDVMMPRMSGFDVCERLKDDPATSDIPVLFLSARGERPHVKRGFHVGADDYLAKPFDPEELLLRVRALMRRSRRP